MVENSFAHVAARLEGASVELTNRLVAAVYQGCLLLEREVKERTPKGATNALVGSIAAQLPTVEPGGVCGQVGTALNYAESVELGTRPHFPPVAPLADWARAKLGLSEDDAARVAFAIARKISQHGTKGAFMFTNAVEATREQIEAMIKNAVSEL